MSFLTFKRNKLNKRLWKIILNINFNIRIRFWIC
jgi:hypothetical protein